jgi:spoIIIJ-associated protein
MKIFTAKTIDEATALAEKELNTSIKDLPFTVKEEKTGFLSLSKKVILEVYEMSDVIQYAENYIIQAIGAFQIQATTKTEIKEDIIRMTLDTNHNSILIGKNGRTLQALNELVRLATSNHFKKRFRILLDINDYKDNKYDKVIAIARRIALEVVKTKVDVTLEPMPADERRVVHGSLTGMPNIKTESVGEGHRRAICIRYVQ